MEAGDSVQRFLVLKMAVLFFWVILERPQTTGIPNAESDG